MNKKELLSYLEPIQATRAMKKAAKELRKCRNEYSYKKVYYQGIYDQLLQAQVFDNIIRVAVFLQEDIAENIYTPRYYVFLDGEEDLTYNNMTKKWITSRVDNLNNRYSDQKKYSTKNTDNTVSEFLKNGKTKAYDAVLENQLSIRADKLQYKKLKVRNAISLVMDLVEKLPEDFEKWCNDVVLSHSRYIYYTYPNNTGYCTHCKREVDIKGHRHNKEGICPKCHSHIIYKAVKKAAKVKDDGEGFYLQKHNDGFMIRKFRVWKDYSNYSNPKLTIYEAGRNVLDRYCTSETPYQHDPYVKEWKKGEYQIGTMWNAWHIYSGKLYYKNLDKVFGGTELKYMPLREVFKRNKDQKVRVATMLNYLAKIPKLEYVLKMELYKFFFECVNGNKLDGYSYGDILNPNAKKPWDLLLLKKSYFNILREMNGGAKEQRVIKQLSELDKQMTIAQIYGFVSGEYDLGLLKLLEYTTAHKLLRYMKEHSLGRHKCGDYSDYVNMCIDLGYDMKSEFVLFPRNLEEMHGQVVEYWNMRKQEKQLKDSEQYNNVFRQQSEEWEKLYSFEDEDLKIVVPHAATEIVREGQRQHHCVATYVTRVVKGECVILFIRAKNDLDTNYYTMELRGTEVKQVRGKYNAAMTEDVENFVEKFKKNLKKVFKSQERKAS